MKINKDIAEHYIWHGICDGWHFVKNERLSVILERMPPCTEEDIHYHTKARQFFYMLSGTGCIILDGEKIRISEGDGVEIEPMTRHQIKNDTDNAIEFIVISSPKSHGDKVIV